MAQSLESQSPNKQSMASLHSETREDLVSVTESSYAKPEVSAAPQPTPSATKPTPTQPTPAPAQEAKSEEKKAEPQTVPTQSTPKVQAPTTETSAVKKEEDKAKSPDRKAEPQSPSPPLIKPKKSVQFNNKDEEEPSPPEIPKVTESKKKSVKMRQLDQMLTDKFSDISE